MDIFVAFYDLLHLIVWRWADVYYGTLQNDHDQIDRLTPAHQRQRDDAERLSLHHRHRVISGQRNNRPAAAVQRHRQLAEEHEDQLNRMTDLLARNRRRVRFLRGFMPAVLVIQFCWGLFLLLSGIFVLLIVFDAI